MIERLEQFTNRIVSELKLTDNNWEESFYRMLLRNFGLNINGGTFYELAQKLPLKIIRKEQSHYTHLEALFLGAADLLEVETEDYYLKTLQKTYAVFKQKCQLQTVNTQPTFNKLRPDNFLTRRFLHFAAFIYNRAILF